MSGIGLKPRGRHAGQDHPDSLAPREGANAGSAGDARLICAGSMRRTHAQSRSLCSSPRSLLVCRSPLRTPSLGRSPSSPSISIRRRATWRRAGRIEKSRRENSSHFIVSCEHAQAASSRHPPQHSHAPQLWSLGRDADGQPAVEHIDTLCGHLKTVNVARFSPGGDILASGVRREITPASDAATVFSLRVFSRDISPPSFLLSG